MRMNMPVTNVEYDLNDDTLIVSKTDTKGKLTYFNDQFVAASGFTDQELMGQPHNIVRHPEMPPAAFEDLWNTIKAGKPWAGAVKNRRKNGDFYWVLASATPIWEGGQISGYMSIRTKLPADQRQEAEHVYGLLRANKAQKYKVEAGIIRRRSLADRFAVFTRTLEARLMTLVGTLAGLLLVVGLAGIFAAYSTDARLQSLYQDRLVRVSELGRVSDQISGNVLALYGATAGKVTAELVSTASTEIEAATKSIEHFIATVKTPETKALGEAFAAKRRDFIEQGLRPGLVMASAGKLDELTRHLTQRVSPLAAAAKESFDKLVAQQLASAKIDYEAAEHNYAVIVGVASGMLFLGLLLGALLGLATIRAIGRPLAHLNAVMAKIAQGQFNSRVIVERDDEIGTVLRNLQAMQNKMGFEREEQRDLELRMKTQRKADMSRMAGEFEKAVGGIVETVSAAATELEAAAGTLTKTAETTQELSTTVAAASEEASVNVQSVASASNEMSSSVNEIARQVQESSKIAAEAVHQAQKTDNRINELSQAANRIGDVVKLITAIAEQTNLLALNATIEAARAGEAGKGFAVVAQEVKALAAQTAKATGEIGMQISGMQAATHESVAAIKEIGGTIGRIAEIASAIAAAVEEQGAATQEIARNVQQAAQGTTEVASNITEVNRGAGETGTASSQVLSSAQSLAQESNRLKLEVDKFLVTVRAA